MARDYNSSTAPCSVKGEKRGRRLDVQFYQPVQTSFKKKKNCRSSRPGCARGTKSEKNERVEDREGRVREY